MVRRIKDKIEEVKSDKRGRNLIMIDGTWGLEIVPMNFIVVKQEYTKKGEVKFSRLSYHSSLKGAVIRLYKLLIEEKIVDESINDVNELKKTIQQSEKVVLEAINEKINTIEGF